MPSPFNPHDVEVLAAAQPGKADNPLGRAARDVIAVHIKRLTPGRYSSLTGSGPLFRDIFFRGVQPNPHEGAIAQCTGLDDGFFSAMAVAVLCEQMGRATSRLRPQLLMAPIANDLNGWNARLTTGSYRFYSYMAGAYDGPIKTALATFPDPQSRANAKQHYLSGLASEAWVNAKRVQESSGQWFDREWELYHHWIKLTALGASPEEIDQTIAKISALGLEIPPAYGPGRWREQFPWFGPGFGANDAADAVAPILASKCFKQSCLAEDNSFEFTANSQPGSRYRQGPPPSSCFAPGTRVVMADGSLHPIEQINPGDEVATPTGPRSVLLRAETHRRDRVLHRFAANDFAFAATHPFINAPGTPGRAYYAAVDPPGLARAVPMLAPFGISPLLPRDTQLVRHSSNSNAGEPWPAPAIEPDPNARPDTLYDLVLDLGEDGRSEYYAGDAHVQVLVSSEVPRFTAAPGTASVLLQILERVTPVILNSLAGVPDANFADLVNIGLSSLSRTLMPSIGHNLTASATPSPSSSPSSPTAALPPLPEAARSFARALADPDGANERRPTIIFEQFVATFAAELQAALTMGWRDFELPNADVTNLLAVDLYDVDLFQPPAADVPKSMELALVRGGVRYVRHLPLAGHQSPWHLTVDAPGYFPEWNPPGPQATTWSAPSAPMPTLIPALARDPGTGTLLWQLQTSLAPWTDATAHLPIPAVISHGYESFEAPLLDAAGTQTGRVRGNVRLLTSEGFAAEWEAHERWQPSDSERLERRLAELASQYITDRFLASVETFRYCAATTDGR